MCFLSMKCLCARNATLKLHFEAPSEAPSQLSFHGRGMYNKLAMELCLGLRTKVCMVLLELQQ